MATIDNSEWANMVPKSETKAINFLEEHPHHNGKGILVAVFDTGVDPGASGLQTTPHGDRKMVSIVDCTGDGDISCRIKVEAKVGAGLSITGLTGRSLKLNESWVNPTGVWKLAMKRGYELFPSPLQNRLKADAKKKWNEKQANAIAAVSRQIVEWKRCNPDMAAVSPTELKKKKDLNARQDYLNNFEFDDPGPIYDIVVWHDGEIWRGAVDCETNGDMSTVDGLAAFDVEHKYGSFGPIIQLNYTLSVHDDGEVVNICCDCGAHGTHVAGIIGAYRPDQPHLNGVAPGCQIMSCKIGDIRVDTMETTRALTRAIAEAVRHGAHVINMSFGEHTSAANTGLFVKVCEEAVNKHGLIFICSAGNAGPALTTAGAPGATSNCIIGIGAYVSPAMMKTCYSMPASKVQNYETKYTWSSVGPAPDGGQGAHITAPGGAITCVPTWTLAKSQLMNGTSMSSPNTAGCVALLLSGLKADGISYTKHRIQRALCNTARALKDCAVRAQGSGLIQVDAAFEYLTKFANDPIEDVEFRVAITSPKAGRGIYLRDASQQERESAHMVQITPCFHENSPKQTLIDFEAKIRLESDQPDWVSVPAQFVMAAKPRGFKTLVDPRNLAPGEHTAHIYGYDTDAPERGPLFRVPITVTRPLPTAVAPNVENFALKRGELKRIFVTPPPGSTSMDIMVKRGDGCEGSPDKSIVVLHTMQLLLNRSYAHGEKKNYLYLKPGHYDVISRKVDGQSSVEICVASYWSQLEAVDIEVDIVFKGLTPHNETVVIAPGSGFARVNVTASVTDEQIAPAAKLSKWCRVVFPTSAAFTPLTSRHDLLEHQQIHELQLEYKMKFEEATSIKALFPVLQDMCYEAELIGGPFVMAFDSKKKVLGSADLYPSDIKVPKGDVTFKCMLRHPSASLLKSFESLPMVVERPLVKPVTLKCFDTVSNLAAQRSESKPTNLAKGSVSTLYFKEPTFEDFPKDIVAGDYFKGTVSYDKVKTEKIGDSRPGGFPLEYHFAAKPTKPAEPKIASLQDLRNDEQKLAESIRDLKVVALNSAVGKETFTKMYTSVCAEYPDDLEATSSKLKHVDTIATLSPTKENLVEVVAQATTVIELIDQDGMISFLGRNIDTDDAAEVDAKEKMNKKRTTLIDALTIKTLALAALEDDAFEESVKDLKRWEKLDDDKHLKINVEVYRKSDHYGCLIKAIDKSLKKNEGAPDAKLVKTQQVALNAAGFEHITDYMKQWNIVNAPTAYPLV
eukprot:m.74252 g.74252  ORF g.74252 m.74252 type:complete len:1245 (+) comp24642_c0_seq1:95-3829(+)